MIMIIIHPEFSVYSIPWNKKIYINKICRTSKKTRIFKYI